MRTFKEAEDIRIVRRAECFTVINRGKLWYDRLNEDQLAELKRWYQAWLDAPETKVIPKRPEWVDDKTQEEEVIL